MCLSEGSFGRDAATELYGFGRAITHDDVEQVDRRIALRDRDRETFVVDLEHRRQVMHTVLRTDASLAIDDYFDVHESPLFGAGLHHDVEALGTVLEEVRHQVILVVGRDAKFAGSEVAE